MTRGSRNFGDDVAYAVRSSATAEDLPTASFAGQQDTYLNVVGPAAILQHVSRCWASLFTERAVTYRLRSGIDHRNVSHGRGDPADGALGRGGRAVHGRPGHLQPHGLARWRPSFGLGEALVSGRVTPDVYKVRGGEVVERTISAKRLAIQAAPAGGTHEQAIAPERRQQPALTDAQVVRAGPAGPADRGALRLPPGHRVVPRGRRVLRRAEPADHHAVPDPAGRRRRPTTSTSPSVTSR